MNLNEHISFNHIYDYQDWICLFTRLPSSNIATLMISICTISILLACKILLEPYVMKKFHLKNLTLPIDILMVCDQLLLLCLFC